MAIVGSRPLAVGRPRSEIYNSLVKKLQVRPKRTHEGLFATDRSSKTEALRRDTVHAGSDAACISFTELRQGGASCTGYEHTHLIHSPPSH